MGNITGIIGAVTGVLAILISLFSYRRVTKMKALDLRVELRKAEVETTEVLNQLPQLLDHANESRFAVAAATGALGSGGIEVWTEQFQIDRAAVQRLHSEFKPAGTYAALAPTALEDKLIETYRVRATVQRYTEKYRAALAADDKEREHSSGAYLMSDCHKMANRQ